MNLSPSEPVFVAGHRGMVGSAIVRHLESNGFTHIVTRTREQLDLSRQAEVETFFREEKVAAVFLAGAKVGGIHANDTYPADFIYDNLVIECNVIQAARQAGVDKLLFLGSSCIYPRQAPQPMHEESLLGGQLEPTNEPYAVAKIAGIKLCESFNRQYGTDYRSVMPTNLYGPGDNFHPEDSHVVAALIRRFHEARERGDSRVVIWGTGAPRREFLHVDDMASACLHVMALPPDRFWGAVSPMQSHVNVGTGTDCSIRDLAAILQDVTGFGGELVFDDTRPDGSPRKLLDVSRLRGMGWEASISLPEGLASTYQWFRENLDRLRA